MTPEQLSRKRTNDRMAQRSIRQRTKERIEMLEEQVRYLTEKNQQLYSENRLLRGQIAHDEPSMSHMLPPQQNRSLFTENSSCCSVPELGGISSVIPTPLPADQIYPRDSAWIDDRGYQAMRNSATECYTSTTEAPIILTEATPEAAGAMVHPNIPRISWTADPSFDLWQSWYIATSEEGKDESEP